MCSNCDAEVIRALVDWHQAGADPNTRIDTFVTYDGDSELLVAAGFTVGYVNGDLVTGSIALVDIPALAATAGVHWVAASARTHLQIDRSMGEIKATSLRANAPPYNSNGSPGLTGKGVLVGIIDNRLTVVHPTFSIPGTSPAVSRIIGYWDQYSSPGPGQKPPSGFGHSAGFNYGIWWNEAAVAEVVANNRIHAIWGSTLFDHGTHVAGIAAGNGGGKDGPFAPFTFVGVAPEADIVFANSAANPVESGRAVSEAAALFFTLAKQRRQGGVPCVVNMSFGTHEGARDGSSALERALDKLMHDANGDPIPGRAIVVSAGNEGDARRHGRKSINAFANVSFRLEVEEIVFSPKSKLSEDVADDRLYFWYDGAASVDVRVKPPRMNPSAWTPPGMQSVISVSGTPIATVVSPPQPDPTNGKRKIDVTLKAPVHKGTWTIELHETSGSPATLDVWVERENNDVWPQLADGDNVTDNTVTSPSTARSVIAVGAYVSEPGSNFSAYGSIAASSSRGLDSVSGVTPDRVRPHLVAPGRRIISAAASQELYPDDIKARFGGWLLGRHIIFSGTSQAAPHVAGVIALMFQKNPTLTYRDVQRILAATTKKDQIPAGLVLPNAVWGAGKLDAAAALAATP